MSSKKKKVDTFDTLGPGMELIRGGLELTGNFLERRCVCSPGGWAYGSVDIGCACGCHGPSSPKDNNLANLTIANPPF
jgi:hypothetical protein